MNVSNELKVSEINFRSKAIYKNDSAFVKIRAYNFNTYKRVFPSGLKERGQAQTTLLFPLY